MKIRTKGENKITVQISKKDLFSFGISEKEMKNQSERTKKRLLKLLQRLSRDFCFDENDEKAKIIINPISQKGENDIFKITLLRQEKEEASFEDESFFRPSNDLKIFEFSDSTSLLDACFACPEELLCDESSAFELCGKYRLAVKGEKSKKLAPFLNEFAREIPFSSFALAQTMEHFNCIAKNNALLLLSSRFIL